MQDGPHITVQHVTTFYCRFGVLAGVSVLWHSQSQVGVIMIGEFGILRQHQN